MDTIFNSFLLVFVSEMGDKTQLLALVLMMKFRKPWAIMAGIFIATILNHALAAWGGKWLSDQFSPQALAIILAATFIFFAGWILIPDKEEEFHQSRKFGAFVTTVFMFFIAEMGDKTQLATVALGAKFTDVKMVTLGTTLGMMGSNSLVIFFGDKILKRIPMKWIRIFASLLFFIFGVAVLLGY